jgi:hypothetical protein
MLQIYNAHKIKFNFDSEALPSRKCRFSTGVKYIALTVEWAKFEVWPSAIATVKTILFKITPYFTYLRTSFH